MQGGIHEGFKPSFAFNGKLAVTYGNRKGVNDPAADADTDHERAEKCGYHATVPRAVEGDHEVKEVLNLVGGKDEAPLVLREQILYNCFRELEAEDWSGWEPLLGRSIGWKDFAAAIRLIQCRAEAAQNHMELPQWYFMTGELEQGGAIALPPSDSRVAVGEAGRDALRGVSASSSLRDVEPAGQQE